ncbi:hypothetical protein [Paraburkholderia sp. SIMBA_030]|uniref:hypothetical protein n=1 Tax=Paraburkholderia sp. SIMBA_030 TaxID=3085773 RepID=UPI00397D8530
MHIEKRSEVCNEGICSDRPFLWRFSIRQVHLRRSRPARRFLDELIEARPNGPNNATETSYPDVKPIFTEQVSRMKQVHHRNHSGVPDVARMKKQAANRRWE